MGHLRTFIFISYFLSFLSCYKNEEIVTLIEEFDHPKVIISATHASKIIDENGVEISDYTAIFNGQIKISNNKGLMTFAANKINKNGELLIVTDIKGNTSEYLLSGIENDTNYSVLTHFRNRENYTFSATERRQLSKSPDFQIDLDPNTYLLDNQTYNGEVNAVYFSPDLSNQFHLSAIPSMRIAMNAEGIRGFIDIENVFNIRLTAKNAKNLSAKVAVFN